VEEKPAVQHWGEAFGQQYVLGRFDTRFRATAQLEELATTHGMSLLDIDKHFVPDLPKHPVVLKGRAGKAMKIVYTDGLRAMEQEIIDLNRFLDQFDIRGGTHRGYIRVFNCGDHPRFDWNLGGRLYSNGGDSYQQLDGAERLMMTIDGKPVCELDIRASNLTIFQSLGGQPLDFTVNRDPYVVRELSATPMADGHPPRRVVKAFITATFGKGAFPARWPPEIVGDYEKKTGESLKQYPIKQVRDAVARAYPLLAKLGQDDGGWRSAPDAELDGYPPSPIWARLMYLESQAVFRTMLGLKDLNIPSLCIHDGLIVQRDNAKLASQTLSDLYRSETGATPHITTNPEALSVPLGCN
jgi:hypothetical protein